MRAAALIGLMLLTACGDPDQQPQRLPMVPLAIEKQSGGAVALKVQVASTEAEQAKGLMWVTDMPRDHGMLFQFEAPAVQNFWMRNTLIPLDILFIGAGGKILHIHENARPYDESGVPSRFPAAQVLEVNGGYVAANGIEIGDRVVVANQPQTH